MTKRIDDQPIHADFYSTETIAPSHRQAWLREVIGREYARVDIEPPTDQPLFNEMTIHHWSNLRLSAIRSNPLGLRSLPGEPDSASQDAYFAVLLLDGRYRLRQHGREAFPQVGDWALYDATQAHRIDCPDRFAKLLVAIPRPLLRARLPGVEHCTALRLPGEQGLAAVAGALARTALAQAATLKADETALIAEQLQDLLVKAFAELRPARFELSASRAAALDRAKRHIESRLADPELNAARLARELGLSARYLNDLFGAENTSLMRYVRERRLARCAAELRAGPPACRNLTALALRWGFNDMAHFSRVFKQRYACPPRDYPAGADDTF